jgi:hypothetical protein
MPTRQLRPVVAADRLRLSPLGHDRIQHLRQVMTFLRLISAEKSATISMGLKRVTRLCALD